MDSAAVPRLGIVVAERELLLKVRGGATRAVQLRIGKPRRSDGGDGYTCVYRIDGLDDEEPRTRAVSGVDSLQALRAAIDIAIVELTNSPGGRAGRLTFLGSRTLGGPKVVAPRRPRASRAGRTARRAARRPAPPTE